MEACGEILNVRDLRDVPTATDGFDQEDARGHPASEDVDSGDFISESSALRNCDFEIAGDSTLVAIDGKSQRMLRGCDGRVFRSCLIFQNSESGEAVFHFLKSC